MLPVCFVDESGLPVGDRFQSHFAIGALLTSDPVSLYEDLMAIWMPIRYSDPSTRRFELRFSEITASKVDVYRHLIDCVLDRKEVVFSVLLTPNSPGPNSGASPPTLRWERHLEFLKELLGRTIGDTAQDQACVVAMDNPSRPLSGKTLEVALNPLPTIASILTLDSHASLPLQAVDVILGAVVYGYRSKAALPIKHDKRQASRCAAFSRPTGRL